MEHLAQFIINHWPLWGALLVILVLILLNEWLSQKKQAKALSTIQAIDQMNQEQAVVFDLREAEAFRAGHIIHAIQASTDDFNRPKMDKYKTKPIILVCARGDKSRALAAQLKTRGFTNAMILSGGMTGWLSDGLPVSK